MTARQGLVAPRATLSDAAPTARPARAPVRLNPVRRQPPAYSPVPRAAITAAGREAASGNADMCAALEDLLRRQYAADHAILCASGTMALQLAIRAALDQADATASVALPAFTCYDVATAAVGAAAKIALYDIDPGTLGPDLDSLETVLRAGAGVIVIAHLFGMPVDWESTEQLARAHGAVVIEDAAQGHGARWKGRQLGALGPISILSFGRGKGWTGGGGGALLARAGSGGLDLDVLPQAPAPRTTHESIARLRVSAQWALGRPALYGLPASIPWLGLGETRYRAPVTPGGMGQFTAALLIHSRAAAEQEAESRHHNGQTLAAALIDLRNVTTVRPVDAGANPGFLRLPARVHGGFPRLATRDRLSRLGVVPSYPQPLAELPAIASRLVTADRRFVGAETLARELVTVPTHSLLSDGDRQQVLWLLHTGRAAAR